MPFASLGLHPSLLDGLKDLGFTRPTGIQSDAIPPAMEGRDLLACATTTLALLIALPLAVVSDRFLFPGKGLLGSLVLIPMILPPFVGAIGFQQMFDQPF